MTKEDAYNNWMWAARDHCYSNQDIWNAACDWQKAQNEQEVRDLKYKLEINRKIVALYEED